MAKKPPKNRRKKPGFIVTDDWDFEDEAKYKKFKTVKLKKKTSKKTKREVKLNKNFRFIVEDDFEFDDERKYSKYKPVKRKKSRPSVKKRRSVSAKRGKRGKLRKKKLDKGFNDFLKQYKNKRSRSHIQRKALSRYEALLRDYREKNFLKKRKLSVREEREEMQQILKNLYTGQNLKGMGYYAEAQKYFKRALKMTTRRDGIPESVPVGESPRNEGVDTSG